MAKISTATANDTIDMTDPGLRGTAVGRIDLAETDAMPGAADSAFQFIGAEMTVLLAGIDAAALTSGSFIL